MELSIKELNLIRQWYNAVEDINPKYLEEKDGVLIDRINSIFVNGYPYEPRIYKEGK